MGAKSPIELACALVPRCTVVTWEIGRCRGDVWEMYGRYGRYGEVREGMGRCGEMWGDVRRYRVRAVCAVSTDEVIEEIGTTWVGSIRGRSRVRVRVRAGVGVRATTRVRVRARVGVTLQGHLPILQCPGPPA